MSAYFDMPGKTIHFDNLEKNNKKKTKKRKNKIKVHVDTVLDEELIKFQVVLKDMKVPANMKYRTDMYVTVPTKTKKSKK